MSSVNDFVYDLQFTDQGHTTMRFIDALLLLKNESKLQNILNKIAAQPVALDAAEIQGDNALWYYVALICLAEFENLVIDEVRRSNPTATSAEIAAAYAGHLGNTFAALKSKFPSSPHWGTLVGILAGSGGLPVPTTLSAFTDNCNALLAKLPLARSTLAHAYVSDFANSVLGQYPENVQAANFEFMRRRFIEGSCGPSTFEALQSISTEKLVTLIKTPFCKRLEGEASFTLLGFNVDIVGASDIQDYTSDVGAAQAILNDYSTLLRTEIGDVNLSKSLTNQQKAKVFKAAELAAREMVAQNEIGVEQAEALSASLNVSAELLLKDPSSPYFGKGYTAQDVIQIVARMTIGGEGVDLLAADIREGLETCFKRASMLSDTKTSIEGLTALFGNNPLLAPEALKFETSVDAHKVTLESQYKSLLAYGKIMYDIKAPEDPFAARKNDGGITATTWTLIAIGITLTAAAVMFVLDQIRESEAEDAKLIDEAALAAHTGLKLALAKMLQDAKSEDLLDSAASMCEKFSFELNCNEILDKYSTAQGFESKKSVLQAVLACIGGGIKTLDTRIEQANERIERLGSKDPIGAWMQFLSGTLRNARSVLEYAMYAALGLGVIWGARKVYTSFKDTDN
jgi:hypothetical protein